MKAISSHQPARTAADKRTQHRYEVSDLSGSLRYTLQARIENLSPTGVALETHHWLQVGSPYRLKIADRRRSVCLTAEVAWCRLVRTERLDSGDVRPIYLAGLSFLQEEDFQGEELLGFIEEHGRFELAREALPGRLRRSPEQAASLAGTVNFVAREISRSGLLIEAGLMIELDSEFEIELGLAEPLLRATVRVTRVQQVLAPEEESPRWRISVRFVGLEAAVADVLKELIKSRLRGAGSADDPAPAFLGTESTRLFHAAGCPRAPEAAAAFGSRDEALEAGYRPAGCCKP